MKRSLIILFIICCLFDKLHAQSASAAIDSLIKYRVITLKERHFIDSNIKANDTIPYRFIILRGLEELSLQKTFHINLHTNYALSYSFDHPNKTKQDSINTSLHILLDEIKKSGLLTNRVYTYTLRNIDSSKYVAEVEIISTLAELSYRLDKLSPNKLLPLAEQFHQYGILSDSSFLRFQKDIRDEKIESSLQFNNYFTLDKELDLDKYPDDPNIWLEQIYRDISSVLPGLTFTNFSYTTSRYMGKFGAPEIQYLVSLTCNGRVYKHSSSILDFQSKNGKVRTTDFFVMDFERLFNKVLADEQSPYRIHSLMFGFEGTAQDNIKHPSFIALQENQAEAFWKNPCMHYVMASMENYDNILTSSKIDSAITGWTKMGLFAHLSISEIKNGINSAEADDWFSIDNLLADFPGVVYTMDSAFSSSKPIYINLVNQLAIITHGAFHPTSVSQIKTKVGIKLQYISKGKVHHHIFRTANGWFDDGFTAFVEHLGEENNLSGNFYSLRDDNSLIYLTNQQHDYAISHNLLDLK